MPTYLLTWNPDVWQWDNLRVERDRVLAGESVEDRWSCGRSTRIVEGDRLFLLRQGRRGRGIVASGWATGGFEEDDHYVPERAAAGETARYVPAEWDALLDPDVDPILDREVLLRDVPAEESLWNTQASGIEIREPAAAALERLWRRHLARVRPAGGGSAYLGSEEAEAEAGAAAYEPGDGGDERQRVMRQIRARRGQSAFREALRARYRDQCLVSGCGVVDVLEAAHIRPYRRAADHHPENGLLLRADLHTLFDLDLLGVEPQSLTVRLHPSVREGEYGRYEGRRLLCGEGKRPSGAALRARWALFQRRLGDGPE